MKLFLLALLAALPLASPAQTARPAAATSVSARPASRPAAAASKVYLCNSGSAYAYHRAEACSGLSRCSHTVSAVSVAEAEGQGRRPCKKCN